MKGLSPKTLLSESKDSIMRTENPECSGRQLRSKWETSAKSCGPKHSEHPDVLGEDKPEIQSVLGDKLAENPECSGRQLGDKWETSSKSGGPKHSEHPECTGRQLGDKPEIMRAENPECKWRQLGDKWETSAKSCGPKHSENPECLLLENKPGDKR